MKAEERILLGHGSGGQMTHDLVSGLFIKHFCNPVLREQTDAAIFRMEEGHLAFTTDSFVVDPIFFPGGDIGKLAVCGTVNDLAVSGARPVYMSASFILEEGLPLDDLRTIVRSMAEEADRAGVRIVTGDTKVVHHGKCDKIFINTTGIGHLQEKHLAISSGRDIRAGDKVIISGSIGDHGMSIMAARKDLNITAKIESDCACLHDLIQRVLSVSNGVRFMRDPTRGGLATVMAELAKEKDYGIMIDESSLVISEPVRNFCEMLGFDPIYVANEGKVVMVVEAGQAGNVLEAMRSHEAGQGANIIGEVVEEHPGRAWMKTKIGGKRILDMLAGEQLPRIC